MADADGSSHYRRTHRPYLDARAAYDGLAGSGNVVYCVIVSLCIEVQVNSCYLSFTPNLITVILSTNVYACQTLTSLHECSIKTNIRHVTLELLLCILYLLCILGLRSVMPLINEDWLIDDWLIDTINSLSLNYPVSSRSKTLLLVLSWKLPSHVISLLSYALFTGPGSLNASNTSSSHLPTKFSQLPNLHTFISSSPLNVLAVLALHPSLLLPRCKIFYFTPCSCSVTFIILSKNNWSLLPLCLTLTLESAPFVSS